MKKIAAVSLVLYNAIFVSFMMISGLLSSKSNAGLGTQLLFAPVLLYLVFSIKKTLRSGNVEIPLTDKKYLAAIGAIFLILFVVGFRSIGDSRSPQDTPIIFHTTNPE